MTVVDTLSRLFKQKVHIQKGGEEILVFCPNCKHHKRKLNINTKTGFYQCWVCNFSGKSFHSLLKKVKAPKEYYDVLCKDVPKRNNVEVKEEKKILSLPEEFKPLCKPNSDIEYKRALSYCLNRNITTLDIVRYNIGYCNSGTFINRVIVPSYDSTGKLNFYCGRSFYDGYLKYRL
jgi:DNA primase